MAVIRELAVVGNLARFPQQPHAAPRIGEGADLLLPRQRLQRDVVHRVVAAVAAHVINNVFAFGYAAAAGGVAQARALQVSTWQTTGWNLLAYALTAVVCWWIGRRMRVSVAAPQPPKAK